MSQDIICIYKYVYIIFHIVFVVSQTSSPSKGVELHHAFSSTPFTEGEGLWLLLRQG